VIPRAPLAAAALLAACGVKGPPRPPDAHGPRDAAAAPGEKPAAPAPPAAAPAAPAPPAPARKP
jgi:Prokaryotic lipoprotein-attachment site